MLYYSMSQAMGLVTDKRKETKKMNTKNCIRCVRAEIFRWKLGDCSNGGISSRFDDVLIPCKNGPVDVDLDNPPENLVKVVRRKLFGREYVHLEPYNDKGKWWMAGGTYVHSCDARFGEIINNGGYPVGLHDRTEEHAEFMD